ncbi:unnamed protein product [Ciceribacter sp. T2.26MG-112.2]|nr:unnamed protein product [Ciceribacter naphthalenivorans]
MSCANERAREIIPRPQARAGQVAERIEEGPPEEDRRTFEAAIRIIERLC